jgi:hypothetical protein
MGRGNGGQTTVLPRDSSSMCYDEYGDAEYDLVTESLKQRSEEAVQVYLGRYGDAIDERVQRLLGTTESLLKHGFPEQALSTAVTAIEIMIRFMVVRPLVQGAFLSEQWSEILTGKISAGRAESDRKLFEKLLSEWDIELSKFQFKEQGTLWAFVRDKVLKIRHQVIHAGETVDMEFATLSVEAAFSFRSTIVKAIEERFGFTLDATGCWCRTSSETGSMADGTYRTSAAYFETDTPFTSE